MLLDRLLVFGVQLLSEIPQTFYYVLHTFRSLIQK